MAGSSTQQYKDLVDFIDISRIDCLNQKSSHPVENCLKSGLRDQDTLILESDSDEQLLINIPFTQSIKLHSISVKGPDDGSGPSSLKLFVNKLALDFTEASEEAATQEVQLTAEQIKTSVPVPLRFVKFQSVTSLTVFVASNQGDAESTVVQKIVLYGEGIHTTNMKEFKKISPTP